MISRHSATIAAPIARARVKLNRKHLSVRQARRDLRRGYRRRRRQSRHARRRQVSSPLVALLSRYGTELACPVYVRKRKFETGACGTQAARRFSTLRTDEWSHRPPRGVATICSFNSAGMRVIELHCPLRASGGSSRRVSSVLNTLWGSMRPFRGRVSTETPYLSEGC